MDRSGLVSVLRTLVMVCASVLPAGCGFVANEPVLDPEVLAAAAQQGVGLPNEEMFNAVRAALAEAYPGLIGEDLDWSLNEDDGVPGQIAVLYRSTGEYLAFVGSPVGAEWSLGPSAIGETTDCALVGGFEITDFVLAGELLTFADGEFEASSFSPGDRVDLAECTARAYRIPDSAWMLEYGRGSLPSTLYVGVFASRSVIADALTGLPTVIISELIRNYVTQAFGLGISFGGF